jgi:hypothetical protein
VPPALGYELKLSQTSAQNPDRSLAQVTFARMWFAPAPRKFAAKRYGAGCESGVRITRKIGSAEVDVTRI